MSGRLTTIVLNVNIIPPPVYVHPETPGPQTRSVSSNDDSRVARQDGSTWLLVTVLCKEYLRGTIFI